MHGQALLGLRGPEPQSEPRELITVSVVLAGSLDPGTGVTLMT
jgi:hypothetical protein